ncbi:MFS transporter [Caloranaerobacter ferrireducens]|uniref:MFS transporter n=1 Tax=Caloranaerobacter ferrireducens TaxID=1323370 RepID=UPI00084DADC8|nr:MFS transporter [Caloranaerobacter ferrireducens]
MNLYLTLLVVFFIQFVISFESSFISPIVPYLADYFSIRESSVIYLNLGFSTIGLFSPLFGMAADKYGKKNAIVFAILTFLSGTVITGWSPSPVIFGLGRMLIGIGNITLTTTLLSYISDFIPYENRGKGAGILRIAFAIAILLSPIYSTNMVKYFNIHYLYWSVSILSIMILFISIKLPKDHDEHISCSSDLNFKEVISITKKPITIKFLIIQFLLILAPIFMFSYLSIWLKHNFNLNQSYIGYVFTLTALGTVIGVTIAAILSDKIGKMKYGILSFILMTLVLAPLPYIKSIYLVIPLTFLYALGLDGGWSAFQAICSEIYPNRRTVFMTLLYFVISVCALLLTIIGPSLFELGGYKLVIGIGTISNILSIILLIDVSKDKNFNIK